MNKSNKETIQQLLEELRATKKDMERFRKTVEQLQPLKHGIYDEVKESSKWDTEIS